MKFSQRKDSTATQQAAAWTEILKQAGSQERAAFDEWLTESPRHVREFLLVSAVDRALDSLDTAHQHNVQELLAQSADDEVVSLRLPGHPLSGDATVPGSKRRWYGLSITALAATLVAALVVWSLVPHWEDYRTATGEQRTVQLADGSVVSLNTQSQLSIRLTRHSRDLRLLAGQAFFKVSPDATRPFRVTAGNTVFRAVGTQLDVYRHPDSSVTLSVVEGRVDISNSLSPDSTSYQQPLSQRQVLNAGEEVNVAPDGNTRERIQLDESKAMAWHQRRLIFRRNTLATVVEEFNRYNRAPHIRLLEDARASERHYSGEFDADDPGSLLELLSTDPKLSVTRKDNEVVIGMR